MKCWFVSLLAVASIAGAAPKVTDEVDWAEKKTRPEVYWQDDTPIPFKETNPFIIVWPVDNFYPVN